jgi:hypothetical protein
LDRFASSLSLEHCLFAAADLSPAAAGFAMEVCLSLGSLLILGAEQAKNRMKANPLFPTQTQTAVLYWGRATSDNSVHLGSLQDPTTMVPKRILF